MLTTTTTIPSWSADRDADKLMDDLFADIDRILDGSSKLPTEPIKPEYVSLQSIVMPKIAIPHLVTIPQPSKPESSSKVSNATQETNQVKEVETPVTKSETNLETKQSSGFWEKLLIGVSLVSVGVTTALLMVSQKKVTFPFWQNFATAPATQTQTDLVLGVDAEFAKYALRSLEAIERKNESKQKTANAGGVGGGEGNPPNLAIPGDRNPGGRQPTTILERIYYPYMVYPSQSFGGQRVSSSVATPQTASTPLPVVRPVVPPALAPILPSPPSAKPSVANTPKVAASLSAATVAPTTPSLPRQSVASPKPTVTAATVAGSATIASPSPSVSLSPSPSSPPPPSPSSATSLPSLPSAPPVNHTLVGVLELGSQSAALFDIDGITQRINIGEPIGTSGWMLVDVKNGEAMIRRNGEVRSVYTGQTF